MGRFGFFKAQPEVAKAESGSNLRELDARLLEISGRDQPGGEPRGSGSGHRECDQKFAVVDRLRPGLNEHQTFDVLSLPTAIPSR